MRVVPGSHEIFVGSKYIYVSGPRLYIHMCLLSGDSDEAVNELWVEMAERGGGSSGALSW